MTKPFPTLLSVLVLALAPLPAFAERGNGQGRPFAGDGFCPPGLADLNPACDPPGQARRGDGFDGDEGRRDPVAEAALAEIMEEALRDGASDDRRADEAALIIGALLGLAALERASREEAEVPPLAPEPEPVSFPEVPARPAEIGAMSDAALPEPLAEAPLGPPKPIGEPSFLLPPPPPLAEELAAAPSSDLAETLDRAAREGDTGF